MTKKITLESGVAATQRCRDLKAELQAKNTQPPADWPGIWRLHGVTITPDGYSILWVPQGPNAPQSPRYQHVFESILTK